MSILLEGTLSVRSNPYQRVDAPQIGMKFTDDDKVYKFYNEYACNIGFSVWKNQVRKNSKNVVIYRSFTCNREGRYRQKKGYYRQKTPFQQPKYQQLDERTGCLPHMSIKLCRNGTYKVDYFEPEHNHAKTLHRKCIYWSRTDISLMHRNQWLILQILLESVPRTPTILWLNKLEDVDN